MIEKNIKYLRKSKGLTQSELADRIGVNRAMIGSYEEQRAQPKISVLQNLSVFFNVSIDNLINNDLENITDDITSLKSGSNLRVLTSAVDNSNNELISVVPIKASAGYTNGYADTSFVERLPVFNLPLNELSSERSYRVFQTNGDSMKPIESGSYIICEYALDWNYINEGKPYIILTKDDGIVFKRPYKQHDNELLLKSDNKEYLPYTIPISNIMEMWRALGYISFKLPDEDKVTVDSLHQMYMQLKNEMDKLKK